LAVVFRSTASADLDSCVGGILAVLDIILVIYVSRPLKKIMDFLQVEQLSS
jgi:hypothetical protein